MTKLKLLCAGVACAVWHFAVCASSYMYPTETVNDKEWSYFPMAGGVEIQKAPVSLSGHVVVPGKLGGQPVIGVRPQAFQACDGITSVTLPDTVREIGDYAFSGLEGLQAVYLPWGLEAIGERAFHGCGIERLYLPGTLKRIGARAFENNRSLTKAVLGSGMTAIGDYMFNGCTELRQLALPKTIEKVGTKPFVGNKLAYRGESTALEPDNGIYVELSNEGDNLGSVSVCGKIRAQHPEIKFVSCLNREPSIFDPDGVWVHENTGSKVLLSFDYNDTILDVPYGEPLGAYLQNFGLSSFDWYDDVNGCEVAVDTVITDKFAGHNLSRREREQSTFPMGDAQLKYIAHEKYIEVCGLDGNAPKTLVIPPEIDGLPV